MFFMELAKNNICKSCMLFNLKHLKWHISFLIHWMVLQFTFDKYENEISQNITSIRGPYEVCCCDWFVLMLLLLWSKYYCTSCFRLLWPDFRWYVDFFQRNVCFVVLNIFLNYWMHILLILNIHNQRKWFMMWFSAIYLMHQWDNQRN